MIMWCRCVLKRGRQLCRWVRYFDSICMYQPSSFLTHGTRVLMDIQSTFQPWHLHLTIISKKGRRGKYFGAFLTVHLQFFPVFFCQLRTCGSPKENFVTFVWQDHIRWLFVFTICQSLSYINFLSNNGKYIIQIFCSNSNTIFKCYIQTV